MPVTTILPVLFVILACVLSCDIFKSLSVPKFATALSINFAAKVLLFVPSVTPLVSILVENVPTPDTLMFGDAIPVPVVSSFWLPAKYNFAISEVPVKYLLPPAVCITILGP